MAVVDKSGLGPKTSIVLVDTGVISVEAAAAELQLTHTIAGVSGDYMAVQGTGAIAIAGVSVVVAFE